MRRAGLLVTAALAFGAAEADARWRLSCTLFDHAERGMRAVLRVEATARASVRRRG